MSSYRAPRLASAKSVLSTVLLIFTVVLAVRRIFLPRPNLIPHELVGQYLDQRLTAFFIPTMILATLGSIPWFIRIAIHSNLTGNLKEDRKMLLYDWYCERIRSLSSMGLIFQVPLVILFPTLSGQAWLGVCIFAVLETLQEMKTRPFSAFRMIYPGVATTSSKVKGYVLAQLSYGSSRIIFGWTAILLQDLYYIPFIRMTSLVLVTVIACLMFPFMLLSLWAMDWIIIRIRRKVEKVCAVLFSFRRPN